MKSTTTASANEAKNILIRKLGNQRTLTARIVHFDDLGRDECTFVTIHRYNYEADTDSDTLDDLARQHGFRVNYHAAVKCDADGCDPAGIETFSA